MSEPYLIAVPREDLFWRPDRCGYTTQLLEAGLYTEEEAKKQERSRPDVDRAVSIREALAGRRINQVVVRWALGSQG